MKLPDIGKELSEQVEAAYAHNSLLYTYLEKQASLQEIVTFLHWDGLQPAFKHYIERWLVKTPEFLLDELKHHIAEEEGHSELFSKMMSNLLGKVDIDLVVDEERLKTLNYTFSPECVIEQDFGFFCGGFYATERMAGKRYDQLIAGLQRFQIARADIEFMVLHSACESIHSMKALEDLVLPLIAHNQQHYSAVVAGINDRLNRSGTYLKWYETNKLRIL